MTHRKKEKAKAPKIEISEKELGELRKKSDERDEYYNKWLKVHAEYENTRKRLEKEKSDRVRFANESIISKLFPIVDNFDRALSSVRHTKESGAVLEGIKLVQKEMHNLFRDHGVEEIKSINEKFNPHLHEAIATVETEEHPEDTVVEEIQRGYTLKGRLLRPAIVKVSKKKK